jgi:hypothetical protein
LAGLSAWPGVALYKSGIKTLERETVSRIGTSSGPAKDLILGNNNHNDGLRLRRDLAIERALAYFDNTGKLKSETIATSKKIIDGNNLKNPRLIAQLEESGGNIIDWGKYTTKSIPSPLGGFQVHFYKNEVTGEIYYGLDHKSIFDHNGAWNIEISPKFQYEHPKSIEVRNESKVYRH